MINFDGGSETVRVKRVSKVLLGQIHCTRSTDTKILTDTLGHVVGCLVDSGHPSGTWFTHGLISRVPHRERVLVVL